MIVFLGLLLFYCLIRITAARMENPSCAMLSTYPRAPARKVRRFCRRRRRRLLFYIRTCVLRLFSACCLSDRGLSASGTPANGPQQVGVQGCYSSPSAEFWARSVLSSCLPAQASPCWCETSQVLWGISFSTVHKCQTALKEEPSRWLVLFHPKPWNPFRSCLKSHSLKEPKPAGVRGSMWLNPEFTSSLIDQFIIVTLAAWSRCRRCFTDCFTVLCRHTSELQRCLKAGASRTCTGALHLPLVSFKLAQ